MKVALLNLSTSVKDADLEVIARAHRQALLDVYPVWERANVDFEFVSGAKVAPEGSTPLVVFESPGAGDEGVEGYHSVDPLGRPYGRVFFACVPGGVIFHDVSGRGESLAALIFHELVEMLMDILANAYQDGPLVDPKTKRSFAQVAVELADPVQELAYQLTIDGQPVDVSNWVYPSWFNARDTSGKYDHMGVLKAPLTLAPGGYAIVRDTKPTKQVFGRIRRLLGRKAGPTTPVKKVYAEKPPATWREMAKQYVGSRSSRRLAVAEETVAA